MNTLDALETWARAREASLVPVTSALFGGTMPVAARDVLTMVFLVGGGYGLLRCVLARRAHDGRPRGRLLSDVGHLGMSAGMIAMLWHPAGDRRGLQLTFSAVGCGWFLVDALKRPAGTTRAGLLHQAVAMAAMFWMQAGWLAPGGPSGMPMPGMRMAAIAAVPGGVAWSGVPAAVTTLTLAGYLGGAALWWLRRLRVLVAQPAGVLEAPAPVAATRGRTQISSPGPIFGAAGDAVCHAVMAAATAALLIVMR